MENTQKESSNISEQSNCKHLDSITYGLGIDTDADNRVLIVTCDYCGRQGLVHERQVNPDIDDDEWVEIGEIWER